MPRSSLTPILAAIYSGIGKERNINKVAPALTTNPLANLRTPQNLNTPISISESLISTPNTGKPTLTGNQNHDFGRGLLENMTNSP
jgi:hypothetical protein